MKLSPLTYLVLLLIALVVQAGLTLWPGALSMTGHEIDYLQSVDIAYRIADGDVPHRDFMTPLGVLSFLPMVPFLKAGHGPGMAYLLSQLAVAAILLPPIWWVGVSRLSGWTRGLYGVGMVMLATAMIFGNANPSLTTSMYYNRWAWVLTGFVVLILMLPARPGWRAPVVDGLILGASGAALALIKATYVIGLLPFVLLVLLQDRPVRLVLASLVPVAAILGWATVTFGGIGFWTDYVGDLLAVAGGEMRSFPGVSFADMTSAPDALHITAVMVLAVVFWRKAGLEQAGLRLLVLGPGLLYITWQNWGNDPKWLFLLAVLLLTLAPRPGVFAGLDRGIFARVLAGAALLLFAPSMINIATSTSRHAMQSPDSYTSLFRDLQKADVRILVEKSFRPVQSIQLEDYPLPPGAEMPEDAETEPVVVNGETLPDCELTGGFVGWTYRAVDQLGAVEELPGRPLLVADLYDHLWLFGPFARVPGMAPWYYGTEDGFDAVEYVVVPFCPASAQARQLKLDRIAERGWRLEEVLRTDLFILLRKAG